MQGQESLLSIIVVPAARQRKHVAPMAVPNAINLIKLLINRKNLAKTKVVRLLSCESPVITVPVIQLFCEVLPDFQYSLPTRELKEASYAVPPHPDSSRQYLALYSVLII